MRRPGHMLTWRSMPHQIARRTKSILPLSVGRAEQQLGPTPQHTDEQDATSNIASLHKRNTDASQLCTIVSQLNLLTNYLRQQEKFDDESQDWKFVAMVIDRLCLILFTILMIVFTSLTLLSAPNFYSPR